MSGSNHQRSSRISRGSRPGWTRTRSWCHPETRNGLQRRQRDIGDVCLVGAVRVHHVNFPVSVRFESKAILVPFGDQVGAWSVAALLVSRVWLDPSASMIYISLYCPLSLLDGKVIFVPSGDQAGFPSSTDELKVRRVGFVPSLFITYISPMELSLIDVKAIMLPSGDQVGESPGSASNTTLVPSAFMT